MPEPDDQRTLCLDCDHWADVALVIERLAQETGPEIESLHDRLT